MSAALTRRLGLAMLGAVLALGLVWALGGLDGLAAQTLAAQRGFRDALAASLRALRAGDEGAMWGLVALAFGYGVLHAAGPGHGKVLIGGYAVARRAALRRMAALAVAASLAQAAVAVVLVYSALGLFGATRAMIGDAGEGWMIDAGHLVMALIGLWLVWRGLGGLARHWRPAPPPRRDPGPPGHHHHHPHHDHAHHDHAAHRHHDHAAPASGADCGCGHRHAPTLSETEAAASWGEKAALIAGIAIRPCTGALMLLVLTWQLGLVWTGIAGVFAMGAGTAVVTVAVAALAVGAREGLLTGLSGLSRARLLVPLLETGGGLVIAAVALVLLRG